jgi:hypothetical protein
MTVTEVRKLEIEAEERIARSAVQTASAERTSRLCVSAQEPLHVRSRTCQALTSKRGCADADRLGRRTVALRCTRGQFPDNLSQVFRSYDDRSFIRRLTIPYWNRTRRQRRAERHSACVMARIARASREYRMRFAAQLGFVRGRALSGRYARETRQTHRGER